MWHSAHGERTLHSAEARLFAETLLDLLDEAGQLDDYYLLLCLGNLTYGQRVSVLSIITNWVLRDNVPTVLLTAVPEAGVAAVFQHLEDCVSFEADEPDLGMPRRDSRFVTAPPLATYINLQNSL